MTLEEENLILRIRLTCERHGNTGKGCYTCPFYDFGKAEYESECLVLNTLTPLLEKQKRTLKGA